MSDDVCRDFDFVFGDWLVRHRRLTVRLAGSDVWDEFDGTSSTRPVLGAANGYQHLWVDATGPLANGQGRVTWINQGRFYSYRMATPGAQLIVAESGANDPEFNLRREPLLMLRAQRDGEASFASLLEAHGSYDGAASIGVRPMFGENHPNCETYIFDFKGDLYMPNDDGKQEQGRLQLERHETTVLLRLGRVLSVSGQRLPGFGVRVPLRFHPA